MSEGPEAPPGLDQGAPRPKRIRAAPVGAVPSGSSPLSSSAQTSAPVTLGLGVVGVCLLYTSPSPRD
eukprot:15462436-Alexandrium_andersonii.AAC.1